MFARSILSLNAVAYGSSRALSSGSAVAGNKFAEREKALEESHIRKHEKEALNKLREQLKANASAAEVHSSLNELEKAIAFDDVPASKDEHVTATEFLNFRKELLNKVRQLEDEVAELKYKLSKK